MSQLDGIYASDDVLFQDGRVFVEKLKDKICCSPEDILACVSLGESRRHVGSTNMNERSSRSHTVLKIIIESRLMDGDDADRSCVKFSALVGIATKAQSLLILFTRVHMFIRCVLTSPVLKVQLVAIFLTQNLVDLAGSEKAKQSGAVGQRLAEGGFINKSLFTLAKVISQLSDSGNGSR